MVFDQVEQMGSCGLSGNAVRLAGINHQLELLACVDKRIHHLHRVLEVNVVVTGAVHLEQVALQVAAEFTGELLL